MTESEKKLYDITKATSSLDDSLTGLEGTVVNERINPVTPV